MYRKVLLTILFCLSGIATCPATTNEQIAPAFSEALIHLLTTSNPQKLIRAMSPTLADWEAEAMRVGVPLEGNALDMAMRHVTNSPLNIERSAKQMLDWAASHGVPFANGTWTVLEISTLDLSTLWFSELHKEKQGLPSADFRFVLKSEGHSNSKFNGQYVVELDYGIKFPGGWRFLNGLHCVSIPKGNLPDFLDEEAEIIQKAGKKRKLSSKDDPALTRTGEKLLRFLRTKDVSIFSEELMITVDKLLADENLRNPNTKLPPKEELEKSARSMLDKSKESAQQVLDQAADLGVDFEAAELIEVQGNQFYPRVRGGGPAIVSIGSLDVTFRLKEESLPADKKHLAGTYIISGRGPRRTLGEWLFDETIRWSKFPDGALDADKLKKLEFDNYVAQHRALPPGTLAPDIELANLVTGKAVKLSDYKGKIVILEWWASWCGPCQEPMSKMQKIEAAHPEWKGKTQIITASIDDSSKIALDHVHKRGWTNTPNFWAGESWAAKAASAFKVTSIPQLYVIDKTGVIVHSGGGDYWTNVVNNLVLTSGKN